MDDIDMCPPWWPNMLWYWLHHYPFKPKPGDPEPPYMRELKESVETILLALQAYAGAMPLAQREESHLLSQVQEIAVRDMHAGLQRLAKTAGAHA